MPRVLTFSLPFRSELFIYFTGLAWFRSIYIYAGALVPTHIMKNRERLHLRKCFYREADPREKGRTKRKQFGSSFAQTLSRDTEYNSHINYRVIQLQ